MMPGVTTHTWDPVSKTFSGSNFKPYVPMQMGDAVDVIQRDNKYIPPLLYDLLVHASPYKSEQAIANIITDYLPKVDFYTDKCGNLFTIIGESETLFSCHMDTVHDKAYKLELVVTKRATKVDENGMIFARRLINATTRKEAVLGADDKLGCYIMCEMIKAGTPGLYVFHVGEERGGIGSQWIAKNKPIYDKPKIDFFTGRKRAIAFDRKGYTDIICHQSPGRCASKTFGDALAKQLNDLLQLPLHKYEGDQRGTFTDTANYAELIPECANMSVGYFNQHGSDEHFDAIWFMKMLMPALLQVKWEELPTERDPTKKEVYSYQASTISWKDKKKKDIVDFDGPISEILKKNIKQYNGGKPWFSNLRGDLNSMLVEMVNTHALRNIWDIADNLQDIFERLLDKHPDLFCTMGAGAAKEPAVINHSASQTAGAQEDTDDVKTTPHDNAMDITELLIDAISKIPYMEQGKRVALSDKFIDFKQYFGQEADPINPKSKYWGLTLTDRIRFENKTLLQGLHLVKDIKAQHRTKRLKKVLDIAAMFILEHGNEEGFEEIAQLQKVKQ